MSTYSEIENAIKFARDFYSDGDYLALYRYNHYSDIEKVNYYQGLLNKHRQEKEDSSSNIIIYSGDISHSDMGDEYMIKGDYNSAIKMFKIAYEEDEEPLDWILPRLSEAYYKNGDTNTAINYLEEILDYDKKLLDSEDPLVSYSGYICLRLIKILIEANRTNEAKTYAKELITYLEPEINDNNSQYISDFLAAYWYLYYFEDGQVNKNIYWNKCIALYQRLKNEELQDDLLEFIKEYIRQDDIDYGEIIEIVNRFNPGYGNEEIRIALIEEIINHHHENLMFRQYEIQLLIKCAEITSDYSYKGQNNPLDYCNKAEELLTELDENKLYYRNKIIKVKAEAMSNDNKYEFDDVNNVREQCDYFIVADYESKNMNNETKIKIWKEAAEEYGYINDYKNQIKCLNQAYEIIVPIINNYDYSRFDSNLWYIMHDLINAWINLSDKANAASIIRDIYVKTLDFYIGKTDERYDYLYKMKEIAYLYERIGDVQKAYRVYLVWLYIALFENSDEHILVNYLDETQDLKTIIKRIIVVISEGQVANTDVLIEYKEAIEGLKIQGQEVQLIQPLLDIIVNNYQNKDVEFK